MPEEQKYIYYASGDSFEKLSKLPQTELLRDKGYDIICLTENVDEFLMQVLRAVDEKELRSVSSGDLGLETEEQKAEQQKAETEHKELFDFIKESLGGKVEQVCLSQRLKSHPVCLSSKGAVSLEMEKILRDMPGNENMVKAQRVLELNGSHKLFQKITGLWKEDKDKVAKYASLLYNLALLIEGMPIEDPVEFSNDICELIQ